MSNTVSSTYCVLPWAHLYTGPDGKIAPCCIGKELGNYGGSSLKEVWNSTKMKQVRLDMLSDIKNDVCSLCYEHEEGGFKSMRQSFLNEMPEITERVTEITNADGSLNTFELCHLDFRFNNLCNFKCRTCNPLFSSSIAVEAIQNPDLNKFNTVKAFRENTGMVKEVKKHYPTVKSIYFAGGEPMMQQEHWDVLKYFVESGNAKKVSLLYSSNISTLTYKNQNVLDYWKHFKNVNVQMSIDCEGTRAEYWRDGTHWETVYNNIKSIANTKYTDYTFHSVISWVNIYSYINLIKHLLDEKLTNGFNCSIWCLKEITEYCLQVVPDFKKEEIAKAIDEFIVYLNNYDAPGVANLVKNMKNIKSFMFADTLPILENTFKKHLLLDKIRNKDFFEYFPEHENMREYIK